MLGSSCANVHGNNSCNETAQTVQSCNVVKMVMCAHAPRRVKDPYFVPCLWNSGLWVSTQKQKSWLNLRAQCIAKCMWEQRQQNCSNRTCEIKLMVMCAHVPRRVKDPYFVHCLQNSGLWVSTQKQKSWLNLRAQCKCMWEQRQRNCSNRTCNYLMHVKWWYVHTIPDVFILLPAAAYETVLGLWVSTQ